MTRRTTLLLAVVGTGLAAGSVLVPAGTASAAGDDGRTPPGKAWVRAGDFVPGMAPVTIRLTPRSAGSPTVDQRVSYGSVSSYRKVEPGTYTVSVRPQGADADSRPMLRRSLTVTSGRASTVAVLGEQSAPRLATLTDDLTPPKPGTARVRVLSGAAGASALSIRAVGGPTIATDVVLGQTTGYASVPDGSWSLAVDARDAQGARTTVDLDNGGVYTAVVLDGTEPSSVRVALVTDALGVAATPKGGAATGLGGTAAASPYAPGGVATYALGIAGVSLLGVAVVVVRRRRPGTR